MNRTLTAAVALTVSLGMAGLAHAQLTTNSSSSPNATPGMTAPTAGPAGTQNPATMGTTNSTSNPGASNTGTMGAQGPQANSQPNMNQGQMNQPQPPMNQGQMNQAQMNQSSMPASRSDIQEAQQELKSQGLYMGAIDGVMGPKTQTAVMAFQREHSLPQSAQLDQQTMSALSGNGSAAGMSGMQQQPGATGMQPGNSNAPVPAGNMNGAPGVQPGGMTTR